MDTTPITKNNHEDATLGGLLACPKYSHYLRRHQFLCSQCPHTLTFSDNSRTIQRSDRNRFIVLWCCSLETQSGSPCGCGGASRDNQHDLSLRSHVTLVDNLSIERGRSQWCSLLWLDNFQTPNTCSADLSRLPYTGFVNPNVDPYEASKPRTEGYRYILSKITSWRQFRTRQLPTLAISKKCRTLWNRLKIGRMVFQSTAGSSIRAWKGPIMRQEGHKENRHTSEIPRES